MKKILIATAFLLALITKAQTVSPGDIVITEIMIDPNSSNEQDREWFEVYNTTSSPIDMNGWTIIDKSSSGRSHTITSATPVNIPANSYAVFVYNDDPAVNIVMPNTVYVYGAGTGNSNSGFPTWNNESTYSNGSTNDDGIGLETAAGIEIDEILYGFGYNGLPAWPAQGAPSATSYQLDANTLDAASNDIAANWLESTASYGMFNGSTYRGTPGAANFAGGGTPAQGPGDIIITEIMIDPNGTEGDREYFEVYNTTDSPIDMMGWVIYDDSSSGRAHEITTSAIVPANSHAVLAASDDDTVNGGISNVLYAYGFNSPPGGTSGPGTDFPRFNNESSFNDGNTSDNETDGIILENAAGTEIDRVIYDYGYGTAPIGFPAAGLPDGASIELGFSYYDVNDNDTAEAWDFAIAGIGGSSSDFGTPGALNDFNKVYTYDNAWLAPFNNVSGNTNATADVVVLTGVAPVTATSAARNVNVDMGATLNIANGIAMSISGDIENSGNVTAIQGSVNMIGDDSQTISGMGMMDLGVLNINNGLMVDNSTTINLHNELNVAMGSFNNTGDFTLMNSATSTAVVNELPSGSTITGEFTVERYIPVASVADGRVFRFLSSPVTTTNSIYDNWQEAGAFVTGRGTHITGSVGAVGNIDMSNGFDQTVSGSSSAYTFSNDTSQSWNAVTSTNQPSDNLLALDGYRVFIRGDRDPSRITASVPANATTLAVSGTINQGDLPDSNYDVDENQFVFVGNPYQATVDMESVLANSDNVNNDVVYYWDPNLGGLNGQGAYTVVSGFASGGSPTVLPASTNSQYLQPGQSAFVVANAGANGANDMVLRFSESDKGTSSDLSSGTVFNMNNTITDHLSITLYDTPSLIANSSPTDAVLLQVDPVFSNNIDHKDVPKLSNIDETLSIIGANSSSYGIESIGQVNDGLIVPLQIDNYGENDYTFRIDASAFSGFEVLLVDNYLNNQTVLNSNGTTDVTFNVDLSNNSSLGSRFHLLFNNVTLSNEDVLLNQISLYPNPSNGNEVILRSSLENLNITLFNSLGQQIYNTNSVNSQTTIPTQGLSTGIYLVNVKSLEAQTTIQLIVN